MTADAFRKIALEYPHVAESSHMNHPDFRVAGKVFATLGYPDEKWAMVTLTPEQQRFFVEKAQSVFKPCKGAWGMRGATSVHLPSAKKMVLRPALDAAWKNAASKVKKKLLL